MFLLVKDKIFKSPLDTDRQGIIVKFKEKQEHLLVRWSCTSLVH